MRALQTTIDITYAKNALFVRQSVAIAFGIPIDRELTWDFLQNQLCNRHEFELPESVLIWGLPSASIAVKDECRMLCNLLRMLEKDRGIEVKIVLHD